MATTYSPANAVPSALRSLTSLFGKGRGGASSLKPPTNLRSGDMLPRFVISLIKAIETKERAGRQNSKPNDVNKQKFEEAIG